MTSWAFTDRPGRPVDTTLHMSVEQVWRLLTNNYREGEHGAIAAAGDSSVIEVLMRTREIIGAPK